MGRADVITDIGQLIGVLSFILGVYALVASDDPKRRRRAAVFFVVSACIAITLLVVYRNQISLFRFGGEAVPEVIRDEHPTQPLVGKSTVQIAAGQPWTATNVPIQKGQCYLIAAGGQIQYSDHTPPGNPSGDGVDCYHLSPGINRWTFPAPHLSCHSLIGRIGPNGVPFEVGSSARFRANSSGQLDLGVNDNWFPDNSGTWVAEVSVAPCLPPR